MPPGPGSENLVEKPVAALHAERFCSSLAPAHWIIRQRGLPSLPSPGDRDETRNGCATRHDRGVRSAGAAVVAGRSRRRSAGRGRRAGISRRGLRRFSHQDRRRQCRGSAPATHHRSACAAEHRDRSPRRSAPLPIAATRWCANFVSPRSWHDDDDVVACPAALPASVALGHFRRICRRGRAKRRRPEAGRQFPPAGRAALSGWLAGRALCGCTRRHRGQAPCTLQARERRQPARHRPCAADRGGAARACSSSIFPSSRSATAWDFVIPAISIGSFASIRAFRPAPIGAARDWSRFGTAHPTRHGRRRPRLRKDYARPKGRSEMTLRR